MGNLRRYLDVFDNINNINSRIYKAHCLLLTLIINITNLWYYISIWASDAT